MKSMPWFKFFFKLSILIFITPTFLNSTNITFLTTQDNLINRRFYTHLRNLQRQTRAFTLKSWCQILYCYTNLNKIKSIWQKRHLQLSCQIKKIYWALATGSSSLNENIMIISFRCITKIVGLRQRKHSNSEGTSSQNSQKLRSLPVFFRLLLWLKRRVISKTKVFVFF